MKYLLFTYLLFVFFACSSPKGVPYELPATLPEVSRETVKTNCDKGKILYEINCAKCHTTKEKRKLVILDFTATQLSGYVLRTQNPEHFENLSDRGLTNVEMTQIIMYLLYKKKNIKKK
jgi:hypothetical protein